MKRLTILTLILCLVLTTGCGCNKKDPNKGKNEPNTEKPNKDNVKEPEASGDLPDKKVNGLEFKNASISFVDDMSTIVATVKNTTSNDVTLDVFDVIIKDKNGKEIVKIPGFIPKTIAPNEETQFISYINQDLSQATDIEYRF